MPLEARNTPANGRNHEECCAMIAQAIGDTVDHVKADPAAAEHRLREVARREMEARASR